MNTNKDLWDYLVDIFELPNLDFKTAAIHIGISNIDAILEGVKTRNKEAVEDLKEIQNIIQKERFSKIRQKEVLASGSESELIKKNMEEAILLLQTMKSSTKEQKFVLPVFRSVTHFKVGDEIMIYVGGSKKNATKYDWVSAKILCPGWDWVMHCHSNKPWSLDGNNGRCYYHTNDQNYIFKRSDFFGLRKMLEEKHDSSFTSLLPREVVDNICSGDIEPLTDAELEQQQEDIIKKMFEVVGFYSQHVPVIAELHGIKIPQS